MEVLIVKEEVVVNRDFPHYYPKFENPIYTLKKQRDELKNELLLRIRFGNFSELYPLISHLNLTQDEREEIVLNWFIDGNLNLCDAYGEALKNNDLEAIKRIDTFYSKEAMRR
mgnify:CR=1 FL=1